MFIAGPQSHRFQNQDRQRQIHGQLRKKAVDGDREGKLKTVY